MNTRLNSELVVIILFCFVTGFFILYLVHKGWAKYSNRILCFYFFTQIYFSFGSVYVWLNPEKFQFSCIFHPILYTWLPLFYFYIISLLKPKFRLTAVHVLHFIPCFSVIIHPLINYFHAGDHVHNFLMEMSLSIQNYFGVYKYIFKIQIFGYIIAMLLSLRIFSRKHRKDYFIINRNALNWIKILVFGFITASLISQFSVYFLDHSMFEKVNWYFVANMSFLIFFSVLFYMAIAVPEIIYNLVYEEKKKTFFSHAGKLFNDLEKYMNEKQPFKNPVITLKELAHDLRLNERILSQVLNDYKKQNFYDYINSYRIKAVKEILNDPFANNRTMLDVLFDCGFNSKTTFNRTFKKFTGYTPSDYRKNQNLSQMKDDSFEKQVSINAKHKLNLTTV
jgi:AraC-like DNA-binding protein